MGAQKRPASLAKRLFIKTEPWGCHGSERWYYTYIRMYVRYSNSIVAGGFDVMSYATRFTPGTSATMRPLIRASTS